MIRILHAAEAGRTVRALLPALTCLAFAGMMLAQQAAHSDRAVPKPGITTEGQRGAQRSRGADGTHEFLGLGAAPDAAAAERGSKTFAASCAFCHGAKATGGDTGPDLLRSTLVLHDAKGELIGPLVHGGRVSRGMPQFPAFTDAELYDIAEFIHLRVELAANRGTYKILDVVTGDPKAGEVWFRGRGNCTQCHSVTGDLAHIGSKLSPPDLQQAFLYPAARGFASGGEAVQKVVVTLPSGERITGTLKHLDDFTVSLYDDRGDYRSIPLSKEIKVDVEDRLAAHRRLLDQYADEDMHNLTAYLVTLK